MNAVMSAIICSLGIALLAAASSLAQDDLNYRKRANRFEGIREKPVSGFDIELLSAQADFSDTPTKLGERFQVRFFLKKPEDVHLTVREIDYRHFYWLDKVAPPSPWRAGFDNIFDWATADVVQRLGDLRISDLGVVARLGRETPGAVEEIAPVVFYQSQYPTRIDGYVFRFRLREDAKVKASIYVNESASPVFSRDLGRQLGGRPFSVRWDVASRPVPEGNYKLVLSGYVLATNDPVGQVVKFYHRPVVK
jgi:hypothetical protein